MFVLLTCSFLALHVACLGLDSITDNDRMQMRRSGLYLKWKVVYAMLPKEEEDC